MQQDVKDAAHNIQEKKSQKEGLEQDLAKKKDHLNSLQANIDTLIASAADLDQEISNCEQSIEAKAQQREALLLELEQLTLSKDRALKELEEAQTQRATLFNALEHLKEEKEQITSVRQKALKEIEQLKAETAKLSSDLESLQSNSEAEANTKSKLEAQLTSLQVQKDEAQQTLQQLNNEVVKLQAEISESKQKETELREEQHSLTVELQSCQLSSLEESVESLEKQVGSAKQRYQQLELQRRSLEEELNELQQKNAVLSKAVEDHEHQKEVKVQEQVCIEEALSTLQADINELKDVSSLQERLSSLEGLKQQLLTEVHNESATETATRSKQEQVQRSISILKQEIEQLQSTAQDLQGQEQQLKTGIVGKEEELKELQQRKQAIEQQNGQLAASCSELESEFRSICGDVIELTRDAQECAEKVSELEAAQQKLKTSHEEALRVVRVLRDIQEQSQTSAEQRSSHRSARIAPSGTQQEELLRQSLDLQLSHEEQQQELDSVKGELQKARQLLQTIMDMAKVDSPKELISVMSEHLPLLPEKAVPVSVVEKPDIPPKSLAHLKPPTPRPQDSSSFSSAEEGKAQQEVNVSFLLHLCSSLTHFNRQLIH